MENLDKDKRYRLKNVPEKHKDILFRWLLVNDVDWENCRRSLNNPKGDLYWDEYSKEWRVSDFHSNNAHNFYTNKNKVD